MRTIDITTWKRKSLFENFSAYSNPSFSVATRLDVTETVLRSKRTGSSFFADFLFAATKALNSIEELRLRFDGKNVVLYDRVDPSYVVMSDGGVIVTTTTEFSEQYGTFYRSVRADIAKAKSQTCPTRFNDTSRCDLFYVSCLPWIDAVSFSNPFDFNNAEQSSIPRLTWGKYVPECDGRYRMTFDIAAHHALLDGEPVARGMCLLQSYLLTPDGLFV